jgi:hypothetical protein
VDDALGVSCGQGVEHAEADLGGPGLVDRPALPHDALEAGGGDQLHDQPDGVALLRHVVHGHRMRRSDTGRGPCLAQRPGAEVVGGLASRPGAAAGLRRDAHPLDGHVAAETGVPGAVDRRTAPADDLTQLVAAGDQPQSNAHAKSFHPARVAKRRSGGAPRDRPRRPRRPRRPAAA